MADGLFEVPDDWWRHRRCQVCGGALSVTYTHTYVVQRQAWVKIGASSNVRRRIGELARPAWTQHLISPEGMDWREPLVVHGILDGDSEHALHRRFVDDHAYGEWFRPGPAMRAFLAEIPAALPLADYPIAPVRWTRLSADSGQVSGDLGQEAALW